MQTFTYALKNAQLGGVIRPTINLTAIKYRGATFDTPATPLPDHADFIEYRCPLYRYESKKQLPGAKSGITRRY